MRFLSTTAAVSALAIMAVAAPVSATQIDFHSTTLYTQGPTDGEGSGRGISFMAEENFTISSVGIFFALRNLDFTVNIYSSTDGFQTGALLNSASANVGGAGAQDYQIAISQSFTAGNYYALSWEPSSAGDWAESTPVGSYYSDSDLPFDVGPALLIDGFEGRAGNYNFGNLAHAAFNVTLDMAAVPLPAGLPLLGAGILGLGLVSRRRKTA